MGANYQQFGNFFKHLLDEYSWNHLSFLYDSHSVESGRGMFMCEFTLGQTFSMLGGFKNGNISHIPFDAEKSNRSTYLELLDKSSSQSHVIVVCAPFTVLRSILLTADDLGMLSTGDFVFFNVDLFINDWDLYKPWNDPTETV
jgi:hypothetical protein